MIVTNVETGWEIIFQPADGLLAGSIAEQFDHNHRSKYWFETVATIIAHDDQKVAFLPGQQSYLTDIGAPKDFKMMAMSADERFVEVRDRIDNCYRKHRWIGMLETMHAEFLYKDREVSGPLRRFLDEATKRRADTVKELNATTHDLQVAYDLMRWCDRCSLILCQNQIPTMGRRIEIITTSDDVRYDIMQKGDDLVSVEPWPFAADRFSVSAEVHPANKLQFSDDDDLKRTIDSGQPTVRCWTFQR
jgi:hypothetical protein